ncbi:MAG: amidoligase family protein [Synergistaceae bacterium]|nr:amidoligase family protein [Synergistaceae bacterium]
MTEKTTIQIANMKKQTIGVEVEMNGITREKAARIAGDFFKTGSYQFTAWRNSYSTWSAWDNQGREWKFQKDVSIHGNDDEKCELVTPILHYEDIEGLQGLLRALRKAGAQSSASRGCGVHIHVGIKSEAGDHTAQTLTNFANIMAAHEEQIGRAIKIDEGRTFQYCRTVNPDFLSRLNAQKPATMEQLSDIWYKAHHTEYCRNHHYNESHYHMLNLHATFTKGTIEFRLFQFDEPHDGKKGGIHCGQLKGIFCACAGLEDFGTGRKESRQIRGLPEILRQAESEGCGYLA